MRAWKKRTIDVLELLMRQIWRLSGLGNLLFRAYQLSYLRYRCTYYLPSSLQLDGRLEVVGTGKFRIGENCRLGNDVLLETEEQGEINIGCRVRINAGTFVTAMREVKIGDDTLIGEFSSIRDANHGTKSGALIRTQPHDAEKIEIGSDVWIGRGCCILKGVSIGDGAVIGANSVVTKNVPAGAIFAGIPASEVSKRN